MLLVKEGWEGEVGWGGEPICVGSLSFLILRKQMSLKWDAAAKQSSPGELTWRSRSEQPLCQWASCSGFPLTLFHTVGRVGDSKELHPGAVVEGRQMRQWDCGRTWRTTPGTQRSWPWLCIINSSVEASSMRACRRTWRPTPGLGFDQVPLLWEEGGEEATGIDTKKGKGFSSVAVCDLQCRICVQIAY